jgi:hypothetical protein
VLIGAACAVILAEAVATCFFAITLYDEGGYLYEGWLVCARGWQPFRDFHTKVPPVLYYFYGIPQALFGPGILVGRIQAAGTTFLALLLAAWAVGRRYGLWAAALTLWCFAATLAGLDQHFRALSIAPAALWTALGLLGVSGADRPWGRLLVGIAAALVLLTRHDLIGIAAALLLGVLATSFSMRSLALTVVVTIVIFFGGIAPFVFHVPRQTLDMLTFGLFSAAPNLGPAPFARTETVSLSNLPWYAMFLLRAYVAAVLMLLPALSFVVTRPWRRLVLRHPLIFAAFLAAAVNLLMRGGAAAVTARNAFYLRDFYIELPLVAAAGAVVAQAARAASNASHRALVTLLAIAAVVFGFAVTGIPDTLSFRRPTTVQGMADAGRWIARHTRSDDRIFSIADPHVFLEAGRELLPRLTHHMFMYRPFAPTHALANTNCFNLEMLLDMLRSQATVAVISQRGMEWTEKNERTDAGGAVVEAIRSELNRNWRLVAQTTNSFEGRISIYRRAMSLGADRHSISIEAPVSVRFAALLPTVREGGFSP